MIHDVDRDPVASCGQPESRTDWQPPGGTSLETANARQHAPDRLSMIHEALAQLIRAATAERQRQAAYAAAALAVRAAHLSYPPIQRALSLLKEGKVDLALRDELEWLADRFDERALAINALANELGSANWRDYAQWETKGLEDPALVAYREARALDAVWFALSPNPLEAALEAIVEAIQLPDGEEALLNEIGAILTS